MIFYFFILFLLKEKLPFCIPPVATIGMEKLVSFFLLLSLFMIFQSLSSDVTFFVNYPPLIEVGASQSQRLFLRSYGIYVSPDKSGNPYSYGRVHFASSV